MDINFSKCLKMADQFFDYIPGASFVTNVVDLFLKNIYLPFVDKQTRNSDTYYQHLDAKTNTECFIRAVPIIGNIWSATHSCRTQNASEPQNIPLNTKQDVLEALSKLTPDEAAEEFKTASTPSTDDTSSLSNLSIDKLLENQKLWSELKSDPTFIEKYNKVFPPNAQEIADSSPKIATARVQIIPEDSKKDVEFAKTILKQNPMGLQHFDSSIRKDAKCVEKATKTNYQAFQFADDSLKQDVDYITYLLNKGCNFHLLQYVPQDTFSNLSEKNRIALVSNNPLAHVYIAENKVSSPAVYEKCLQEYAAIRKEAMNALPKGTDFSRMSTEELLQMPENAKLYEKMKTDNLTEDMFNAKDLHSINSTIIKQADPIFGPLYAAISYERASKEDESTLELNKNPHRTDVVAILKNAGDKQAERLTEFLSICYEFKTSDVQNFIGGDQELMLSIAAKAPHLLLNDNHWVPSPALLRNDLFITSLLKQITANHTNLQEKDKKALRMLKKECSSEALRNDFKDCFNKFGIPENNPK